MRSGCRCVADARSLAIAGVLALGTWASAQTPADTYVVQSDRLPVTLDPARAYDTGSTAILENVYETLLTFEREDIDELVAGLATAYDVSRDGTTYTFALRQGVEFHSGNPLACRDAEYSFERGLVTAHPESAFANLLVPALFGVERDGGDPDAYAAEVGYRAIDDAVSCLDDSTLRIELAHPNAALPAMLAYPAFSIVDRDWAVQNGQWDGTSTSWREWIGRDLTLESFHDRASGTGAYRLTSWSGDVLVFERFDAYWRGAPQLAEVVVSFVPEPSVRMLALRRGDADRIAIDDPALLTQLRTAPGVTVHASDAWAPASVEALLFNFAIEASGNEFIGSGELDGAGIPPEFFHDDDVRKGFAHLLDHQRYIDEVLQGAGTALAVAMPPSFPGYVDDAPLRTLDLAAAERHLRAAFDGALWELGFVFSALGSAGRSHRALEMIAENLESMNPRFRMHVVELARPTYFDRLVAGQAPMATVGWRADYADPANFLETFYASFGAAAAFTRIDLAELDELLGRASTTADAAEREALYQDVARLQHELVPVIPLPLGTPFVVTRTDLEGVYYNPLRRGAFLWRDIRK